MNRSRRTFTSFGLAAVALIALTGSVAYTVDGPRALFGEPDARQSDPASPYQAEILRDGVVTDTEMESAAEATVACIAAKGSTYSDARQT